MSSEGSTNIKPTTLDPPNRLTLDANGNNNYNVNPSNQH